MTVRAPLPVGGEAPTTGPGPGLALTYFGAAVTWLVLGSAGLVLVAPELARSNLFAPRVLAVTHAFTLGVIVQAVFGAMHQFLPAVVGIPIRHPRTARAGLLLFLGGTPLLVAGFWWWRPSLQAAGWLMLFCALGCASMNLLPARRHAVRFRYVGALVSLAHSFLGIAMLLAALRIGNGFGWWEIDRVRLLAAHFHLGVAGFGTLTALAFGSRMLPAFLGAEVEGSRRVTVIAVLVSAGLLVMSLGLLVPGRSGFIAGGSLLLAAAFVHLSLLAEYFQLRQPGRLDPGLGIIAAAVAGYGAALLTGGLLLVRGGPRWTLWAGYGFFAIVGWLVMLILGVMHRVAPRLVVLVIAGPGRSLSPATRRAELVHAGLGWVTCGLLALGLGVTGSGILAGHPGWSRLGAGLFAIGAVLVLAQAVRLTRIGRSITSAGP